MKPDDEDHEELPEDALCEMASLGETRTGVKGTIFVSTKMGWHRPRVKYYADRPKDWRSPSLIVSISSTPKVLAHHIGVVGNQMARRVIEWVKLNHGELTKFWNEGYSYDVDEVSEFIKRLKRLS